MARFKLVSNVSEFGLFRSVALTRVRLIVAVVIVSVVMIAAGLAATTYIIETSSSVSFNIVIITALMVLVMLASYLQAMLIGDLTFKGPWREQVILGERPWKSDDPDVDVVVSNHNAEFMILLILLVVGNAFLLNFSGGGFLDRYHEEGFFMVRMRSDDSAERLSALRDMSDPTQFDLWENAALRQLVTDTLGTDDAQDVRAQAAWNAGIMEIQIARKPLIALVADPSQGAKVREEAAVALGRLGPDDEARLAMEKALEESKPEDDALHIGLLRGLGMLGMSGSYGVVLPYAKGEEMNATRQYALWALHRTAIRGGQSMGQGRAHRRESPDRRASLCAARCDEDALEARGRELGAQGVHGCRRGHEV